MSQKDEIKQKVLIRRKFNQNGKFQWEKGKGGWVGGKTLFSSSLLIWGVKLYFPTVKNWCGNERWAFFCLCVTEANLSWDKTYHSVNFIMFNFVLGREQTVSVLYNHILRLPTCHWVMTFFFSLFTICNAGENAPFLVKILNAKYLFDQKDTG